MLTKKIIGRKKEIDTLDHLFTSNEAEFLAIYGRRRVGKTHLIREYFSERKCRFFQITGQKDGSMKDQLENFSNAYIKKFADNRSIPLPRNWKQGFELLTREIENTPENEKFVLFIDELPWLAGFKSKALQALDYYWNHYWSRHSNFILICCGSAASWMLENLINAKGGLYNRLTKTIHLKPFNLKEVKDFLSSRNVKLNFKQILDIYMVFGGIPHYLKHVDKGLSVNQIINNVCFQSEGLLYNEFENLFASLFDFAKTNLLIFSAIASKRYGISRNEIIQKTKISSGGTLTKRLNELEAAGFIEAYIPFGQQKKDFYRVIDEYSYFYIRWIEPLKRKGNKAGSSYWTIKSKTPSALVWFGYAFENVCFQHIEQIRKSLGLDKIGCEIGNYRFISKKGNSNTGTQIDLIFDRDDGSITLCEIKYSEKKYTIDKNYARLLMNKINVFEKNFSNKKQIFFSMISTKGIQQNIWSEELIQSEVVLEDFFNF